nr:type II CAAX endopeptidase family protein [uncultured Sellimonas sp.]
MNRQTKPLKPYHGILVLILTAVCVFLIGPALSSRMGLYGTLVSELLMLAIAVGCTFLFHGNPKYVFPVRKPTLPGLFGTFLFWMGMIGIAMAFTMVLAIFFPNEIMGTSEGLSYSFLSVPALIAILIVSITPAVCEEAVFRGIVFNSFWPIGNQSVVIVLTGCIFGAFHGSIWRFFPTAILGMAMGYLLAETGNMVYNMVFHAVNNLLPLALMFGLQKLMDGLYQTGGSPAYGEPVYGGTTYSLMAAGVYIAALGVAVVLVYAGNFLIHMGRKGYEGKMFAGHRRRHLYILIGTVVVCFVLGCMMVFASAAANAVGHMIYY